MDTAAWADRKMRRDRTAVEVALAAGRERAPSLARPFLTKSRGGLADPALAAAAARRDFGMAPPYGREGGERACERREQGEGGTEGRGVREGGGDSRVLHRRGNA